MRYILFLALYCAVSLFNIANAENVIRDYSVSFDNQYIYYQAYNTSTYRNYKDLDSSIIFMKNDHSDYSIYRCKINSRKYYFISFDSQHSGHAYLFDRSEKELILSRIFPPKNSDECNFKSINKIAKFCVQFRGNLVQAANFIAVNATKLNETGDCDHKKKGFVLLVRNESNSKSEYKYLEIQDAYFEAKIPPRSGSIEFDISLVTESKIRVVRNSGSTNKVDVEDELVLIDVASPSQTNKNSYYVKSSHTLHERTRKGWEGNPTISSDSKYLYYLDSNSITDESDKIDIVIQRLSNDDEPPSNIPPEITTQFFNYSVDEYKLSCSDSCIIFTSLVGESSNLYQIGDDNIENISNIKKPLKILDENINITKPIIRDGGLQLYFLSSSLDSPPRLFKFQRKTIIEKFNCSDDVFDPLITDNCKLDVLESDAPYNYSVESFQLESENILGNINGLVLKPNSCDCTKNKCRSIIAIHGGPAGSWSNRFDAFPKKLVEEGYIVFLPNITGSIGYGVSRQLRWPV